MNVSQRLMVRIERDPFIAKSFPLSTGTYDAIQLSFCSRPVLSPVTKCEESRNLIPSHNISQSSSVKWLNTLITYDFISFQLLYLIVIYYYITTLYIYLEGSLLSCFIFQEARSQLGTPRFPDIPRYSGISRNPGLVFLHIWRKIASANFIAG